MHTSLYILYSSNINACTLHYYLLEEVFVALLIAQFEEISPPLRVRTITRRVPLDTLIYFVPVRLDIQLIIKRLVNMI